MKEIRRICGQLQTTYKGPAWHGPSVLENLGGVDAARAAAHPIPGGHSIWEIVRHLASWQREVAGVLGGKPYVSLQGADDWPPAGVTDSEWRETLSELAETHSALIEAIEKFPSEDLDKAVPGRDFTFYVLLHGVAQHNLYHAGQIGLLRRAAR